jgi:glyoxylase-like metal-dependent hydrolase (beta-lactamase superfamily II)
MKVVQFTFNLFQEQCYVVWDEETLDAVVIDPGCGIEIEWNSLKLFVEREELHICHILVTHSHVDHVMGTAWCTKAWHLPVEGSQDDELLLPTPQEQVFLFNLEHQEVHHSPIALNLKEGDVITFGQHRIEVIDVPGHSPHGLCFYLPEERMLFSGDVLFMCSIGRTDFGERFGCSYRALTTGIAQKLFNLPGDVAVYPGHGPQTSIENEMKYNPYV